MSGVVDVRPAGLERLNGLPATAAAAELASCCAARGWVDAVVGARPYAGVDDLLAASDRAITDLGPGGVDEALAAHPRIGQQAAGSSTEASWSRQEQSGMNDADAEVRAALLHGNREYEQRFGRVFLIRAAGRTPSEMLAQLRRRLGNDPQDEQREVAEQLRQITRLRLQKLVES